MSLIDDVQTLAKKVDAHQQPVHRTRICNFCGAWLGDDHTRCPVLALPRILAAAEAAERVLRDVPPNMYMTGASHTRRCRYCGYRIWVDGQYQGPGHKPDCPWQALVSALKGEE